MFKKSPKLHIILLLALLALILGACSGKPSAKLATMPPAETSVPLSSPELTALPDVRITELMSRNAATLTDSDGFFADWLELSNFGDEPADLEGFILTNGSESCVLGSLTVWPGEYVVIFCSADYEPAAQTNRAALKLSKKGGTVSLLSPDLRQADCFTFPAAKKDEVFIRDEDGNVVSGDYPTPGFCNTLDSYFGWQDNLEPSSPLVINEVQTYNNDFQAPDGQYYDWIELKNISSSTVRMSDYYLSDDENDPYAYRFPDYTLSPGELTLVFCGCGTSGCTPFGLSSTGERLYLNRSDGSTADYMNIPPMHEGMSYGRLDGINGQFILTSPSPCMENGGEAFRLRAQIPVLLGEDGVFEGVDSVTVELSGEGTIYYTTDGSTPDIFSEVYTSPLIITETSVIRARCIVGGLLDSEVLTLSYFLNCGHELPVVSLVTDEYRLWGEDGVYSNPLEDLEDICSVAYYGSDGSFTIDCGMKLHGETSKLAQSKKSIKLCFRSRYAGELNYDLFGNGITEFSSILLRSAQEDTFSTQMRDIIMHKLSMECCPGLPSQDYKYCVLYINGRYWGLYALREAHSADHYANHYGYDSDSITMWKEVWGRDSLAQEVYQFIMNNDMSVQENYEYAAAHIDTESLIAWCIIQAYSGNLDLNSPNVRFYYSVEDQVMRYALVDLDLSMYPAQRAFGKVLYSGYAFSRIPAALIKNDRFREQFLTQLSEYIHGPLSDEHVLEMITEVAAEIESEIPNDRERWGGTVSNWYETLDNYLRTFVISRSGRARWLADDICDYLYPTAEERALYFSDLP